jgi:signal peptidase I
LAHAERGAAGRIASTLLWWVTPCVVLGCVALYFGVAIKRGVYPPLVPVQGTSMQPLLHAGDIVLLKHANADELKKGDIVAFKTSAYARKQFQVPDRYVHRIVTVSKGANGALKFETKGDNVGGKDPFWTQQSDVVGLYSGHVGKAGYLILFSRSRQGRILGGALLLVVLLYLAMGFFERRAEDRERTVVEFASMVDEVRELAGSMVAPAAAGPGQGDVRETLRELVGAVSEYGTHLRSHTAVMQNLAATTAELQAATRAMRVAVDGANVPASAPYDAFDSDVAFALDRGRRTIDVLENAQLVLRQPAAS